MRRVALWLTAPRYSESRAYVIMLKGKDADMELRLALEATEWDSGLKSLKTVAVDCGISADIKEKCRKICRVYGAEYLYLNGYIDNIGTYAGQIQP